MPGDSRPVQLFEIVNEKCDRVQNGQQSRRKGFHSRVTDPISAVVSVGCGKAVAPRAGAWIETSVWPTPSLSRESRSPCGSVDRNSGCWGYLHERDGRSPCGSVDRNDCDGGLIADDAVAPRAGAWIETDRYLPQFAGRHGRSPCGSVDRNSLMPLLQAW